MNCFQPSQIDLIEIDLSTLCNAKCPLCMRQSRKFKDIYGKPFYRSGAEILNQIEQFPNLKHVYLIGQMSEPTLHPEFLEIVKRLKELHQELKICTNGSTRDADFWRNLGNILDDNDRVWFAICGSTQEIHSRYRIGTDLKRIIENADALRSVRKVDGAKCIRFSYNENDFRTNEFKRIVNRFSFVEYTETCYQENVERDFLPCVDVRNNYQKIDVLSRQFNKIRPGNTCQGKFEKYIQIDPFGNIFPCYRFLEMCKSCWDGDYDKIENGQYDLCRFCNNNLLDYIDKKGYNNII